MTAFLQTHHTRVGRLNVQIPGGTKKHYGGWTHMGGGSRNTQGSDGHMSGDGHTCSMSDR